MDKAAVAVSGRLGPGMRIKVFDSPAGTEMRAVSVTSGRMGIRSSAIRSTARFEALVEFSRRVVMVKSRSSPLLVAQGVFVIDDGLLNCR